MTTFCVGGLQGLLGLGGGDAEGILAECSGGGQERADIIKIITIKGRVESTQAMQITPDAGNGGPPRGVSSSSASCCGIRLVLSTRLAAALGRHAGPCTWLEVETGIGEGAGVWGVGWQAKGASRLRASSAAAWAALSFARILGHRRVCRRRGGCLDELDERRSAEESEEWCSEDGVAYWAAEQDASGRNWVGLEGLLVNASIMARRASYSSRVGTGSLYPVSA